MKIQKARNNERIITRIRKRISSMSKIQKVILSFVGLIIILGGVIFVKGAHTFSVISGTSSESLFSPDDERWDILILGNRGDNAPGGGFLTDSIMILSYEKETGKSALFSIPRDFYVDIPENGKQRINAAYITGEEREPNGGGLKLAKEVLGDVTSIKSDAAIVMNVDALEEVVDVLGGIDIEEDRYFYLDFYGHKVNIYPGTNHLSGSETLAYVGSRAVDSDFGRMDRQQKVMIALKKKMTSLGFLARPDKIWNLLDSVSENVKTDFPLTQIKSFTDALSGTEINETERVVFDTSNYLYSTRSELGAYILLPNAGDYSEIHEECQGVFQEKIVEDGEVQGEETEY